MSLHVRPSLAVLLGIIIALWAASAAVYPSLPDRLPMHFALDGTVNRWDPTSVARWFLFPTAATALGALLIGLGVAARVRPELINYPGKEDLLALPQERRGPALTRLQAMMDWIAVSVVTCLALVEYVIFETAMGRPAAWLVPVAVGIAVVGAPVAILVQSERIRRAVSAARGSIQA
jgi:uncharacterized membrane protein